MTTTVAPRSTARPTRSFAAFLLAGAPAPVTDGEDEVVIDLRDGATTDLRVDATVQVRPARGKAALDFLLALLGLVALAPLLLILGTTIALTSGARPWYSQERVGRNGRTFRCYKLRTMVPNAEAVLRDLLANDPEARQEFEENWKLKHDPRITPIGRVLRKTSLDELPQLVNVLRGEMALVGPRPVVTDELPRYGEHVDEVLSVRPGLTGLWQISGRNDVSYAERVQLDVAYVRRCSLRMDVSIIGRTAVQVLVPFKNGAC